jgi:ABC-type sugar transport system permease subunit
MNAINTTKDDLTAISRPRSSWWRRWGEETVAAYLFILPAMIILLVFAFFPVIFSVVTSFMKWNLPYQPSWIGLDNYQYLFQNPIGWAIFRRALANTLYFAAGAVPLNMIISLVIALFLNQRLRGVGLFRTAYFLPTITSTVAVSVVWMWLYHPSNYGLFNTVLLKLGLPVQRWLRDPVLAMPALIAMGIWHGMGYNIIIFLAGLQGIPAQLYEAAKIDGAGSWAQFRKITWPLLSPTTFYVLVIGVINAMQAFSQMHVMTQGGPLGRTTTIVYYLYQLAFENFSMGRASAVACILFVLLLVLTLIQFRVMGARVHYE